MTKVLEGKKGLVVGIANDHSIACGITKCLHEEGASMYLTYQNDSIKKRVEPLSQKINCLGIMPCDVSDTSSLESVRDSIKDNIDFFVHAVAYSDKNELSGKYLHTTKDNFLKSTTTYNFHHLAMHSMLEEDYSKSSLVFTNQQKVYFNELYQLNFPSKMVVLSACSTGLGVQESGEGIMSLSRALAYSGVKSSVYSLWQVPDKETSEIMISFYENLKKGQAKDEALANAKNTFIKKNPMKNHPFYWAGFIVNGDTSPIVNASYNWIFYLSIGVLVLVFLFVFRKKLVQFRK